jgi:hypothetical protein
MKGSSQSSPNWLVASDVLSPKPQKLMTSPMWLGITMILIVFLGLGIVHGIFASIFDISMYKEF